MIKLGEEQAIAFDKIKKFIKSDKPAFSLTGPGGSGKSFLISTIIDWLEDTGIDYCLCAPTHKAKAVIKYYSKRDATTLHKLLSLSPNLDIIELDFKDLLFKMGKDSGMIPYKGLVICDEASMISDDLFRILLKKCSEFKSKILFISDKCQLKPVDSDRVSLVYDLKDSFNLTKIYRQSSESAIMPILETLREHQMLHFDTSTSESGSVFCESNFIEFFNLCKNGIKRAIDNHDIFESKILAFTNNRVSNYNEAIAKHIFGDSKHWHKGEILMGCENLKINKYNFWNSMDYLLVKDPKPIDIRIPYFMSLPAFELSLYDTGNNETHNIKILDKNIDPSIFESLAAHIDSLRLQAIDALPKYRGIAWGKYYSVLDSFTTPVDLRFDGRLIRKKSFDRGYALTIHKSQGSSYNNVYVDMTDVMRNRDPENLRQLQYVALSRTRGDTYIFQK